MGNQEQQYYRPEMYPPPQHQQGQYSEGRGNVNVDPREQMMYGESEYVTRPGEKLQPQRTQRGRKGLRLFWLAPVILLVLIWAISHQADSFHAIPDKYAGNSGNDQSFNIVAGTPRLVINDSAGTITIHTGSDNNNGNVVTVHVDKSNDSIANPNITFDKGTNTIVVNSQQVGTDDNAVNIDITTPSTSAIQLDDGNGSVSIDGVTGTIDAHTNNGSINASHITGQAVLSTNHGSVDVSDSQLSGSSSLYSVDSDIHYNGSLNVDGHYTFSTGNGSVDVTLPNDASFNLNANSGNGSVNNDFGSDTAGSGMRPLLTLHTNNGSIEIHKG